MVRVSKSDLLHRLNQCNSLGADLSLDWAYGGVRVENGSGSEIKQSYRGTKSECYRWLEGYKKGILDKMQHDELLVAAEDYSNNRRKCI